MTDADDGQPLAPVTPLFGYGETIQAILAGTHFGETPVARWNNRRVALCREYEEQNPGALTALIQLHRREPDPEETFRQGER